MRISDWSSDVCSSDLGQAPTRTTAVMAGIGIRLARLHLRQPLGRVRTQLPASVRTVRAAPAIRVLQLGRASCRESVCQSVKVSVVAVSLKKTKLNSQ